MFVYSYKTELTFTPSEKGKRKKCEVNYIFKKMQHDKNRILGMWSVTKYRLIQPWSVVN